MLAVHDNEASAASLSLAPWKIKLTAFALSGAIATFAGLLYGGLLLSFSAAPGDTFSPSRSLSFVVIAVLGGITSITGAILGALWVEGIPRLLGEGYALLSSGLGVVLILLLMPGGWRRWCSRCATASCATSWVGKAGRRTGAGRHRPADRQRAPGAGRCRRRGRSGSRPPLAARSGGHLGALRALSPSTTCRCGPSGRGARSDGPNGAARRRCSTCCPATSIRRTASCSWTAVTSPGPPPTAAPGWGSGARTNRPGCSRPHRDRCVAVALERRRPSHWCRRRAVARSDAQGAGAHDACRRGARRARPRRVRPPTVVTAPQGCAASPNWHA